MYPVTSKNQHYRESYEEAKAGQNEGKSTHHPTIATINIYFVPQHNKWKVFRVSRAGLKFKAAQKEKGLKIKKKNAFSDCMFL